MPTTATHVSQETHEHFNHATGFLQAWKEGVELVGPSLFGCQAATPRDAIHWRQLSPKLDLMRKALPNKSKGEACLMACMAGLYNAEEGQKMMNKAGATFGDMALTLGDRSRSIIARLLQTYRGW